MENWIEQATKIGISLSLVQIEQFKQYIDPNFSSSFIRRVTKNEENKS